MNKKLFKTYADLTQEISLLEEKKEALRDQVLAEMLKENADKIEADYGTFSVTERRTYTYTDKVKKLDDLIKKTKKLEVDKGLAKVEISKNLRYQSKND